MGLRVAQFIEFIGRNTLATVLFSPIFTLLAKTSLPFMLAIDKTDILYGFAATAFAIGGSLCIALIMDMTSITRHFTGRERFTTAK